MIKKRMDKDCGCNSYDLVFMDCNMPIMNGYDTCIKLKEMMTTQEINPVYLIAVTADITKQNIKKCKISGFQKIMEKPINRSELQLIIKCYEKGILKTKKI